MILQTLVISFVLLVCSLYMHELGHRKKARSLGYNAVITWENKNPVTVWSGKPNNREDNILIIRHGVLVGYFYLFLCFLIIGWFEFWAIPLTLLLYSVGCRDDLRRLERLGASLVDLEE